MPGKLKYCDLVLAALLLLPLLLAWPRLWAMPGEGAARWLGLAGLLAGVAGLCSLLVTAAMCIRLPRLDRWLGGLPRLWRLHRRLGFIAFILILGHALLLGFAALPESPTAATKVLFPPLSAYLIWVGWLALAVMVVFLAPTFQLSERFHYQRWKRLHLLSALTLLLALLHALPLSPDNPGVWLLILLAWAAIAWRKLLAPTFARQNYRVTALTRLAPDVMEISLRPSGAGIAHQAGQFVYLTPREPSLSAGCGEEHPFTISSAPGAAELTLGIKALGDASRALHELPLGSQVQVEGPYGQLFERRAPARAQLWLGGGIGIAPFVSAARALAGPSGAAGHVSLLYLADRAERAYYLKELQAIAAHQPRLSVTTHYFFDCGPLSEAFLQAHCPDFREREIYICGPPAMLRHVQALLRATGADPKLIHTEAFEFL
ncbi:ferredoxin reductase family protein [Pseudomonas sp. LPB0260]|uniref:ferredoxin reductase family protein n=1 Tax=Pseudomonas sp. LPB0260 TaxID=2614442 RepID=UPI0015C1D771|nr:ferredoxin reductase family protein [Pseudomonas sp. LPB0260]QLC73931.1 ferredoxin reductase family protein [Pseudomonas sp. LPB0260]QLC76705.1 ferredoxin reductase family protein [Pseudomonas sp. LPB0260]